jgi:ABC-type branched-subunit amino acid transport system substrate-binding protein
MSTALTGLSADLGLHTRTGVEAALAEYNASLPAGRPRARLIALDDGYEPDRCAPNMRQLIEQENVLAVIGNVGTPTAVAAIPIANRSGTPFSGAFTGAGVLRKTPPDRYVINYRASYAEESAAMVDALVGAGLEPQGAASFTQRDAFDDAGFNGGIEALRRHGLTNATSVAHGRYERNTVVVESALAEIRLTEPMPRAVIMVGSYKPCAEFIRQAREVGFEPLFLNVSFVGPNSLAQALGDVGDSVIITQVVPHFDADLPVVARYRKALASFDPKAAPSFGSLEGYIAGNIFTRDLFTSDGQPDRERIVDALLGLGKFDLGLGAPLELGPASHQACHQVWPTIIEHGKVVPFAWRELGERLSRQ